METCLLSPALFGLKFFHVLFLIGCNNANCWSVKVNCLVGKKVKRKEWKLLTQSKGKFLVQRKIIMKWL